MENFTDKDAISCSHNREFYCNNLNKINIVIDNNRNTN